MPETVGTQEITIPNSFLNAYVAGDALELLLRRLIADGRLSNGIYVQLLTLPLEDRPAALADAVQAAILGKKLPAFTEAYPVCLDVARSAIADELTDVEYYRFYNLLVVAEQQETTTGFALNVWGKLIQHLDPLLMQKLTTMEAPSQRSYNIALRARLGGTLIESTALLGLYKRIMGGTDRIEGIGKKALELIYVLLSRDFPKELGASATHVMR